MSLSFSLTLSSPTVAKPKVLMQLIFFFRMSRRLPRASLPAACGTRRLTITSGRSRPVTSGRRLSTGRRSLRRVRRRWKERRPRSVDAFSEAPIRRATPACLRSVGGSAFAVQVSWVISLKEGDVELGLGLFWWTRKNILAAHQVKNGAV